ncbi:choline kinase family protein [Prosthecodimorpha staleyi]|uniref:Phosphotransferase n=1 Tax=Prosthecodimorpha staleyi TaxID=2840188 RepID=A0A947D1X4_9HYPH|nr:choline kinase family protein [Prosthecodimorpha staleyi]MBT9289270.1 phosphotransferase [Prosthecodimorpha staleyi]
MTDLAARAASLACWSGPVSPRPLSGGMTNANFVVEDRGARYVVRIGGDIPHHGILRRNELAASRAAAEIGVSPPVFHVEPGALVVGFIDGRTFRPEDVRDPANLPRLVDLVRRAHTGIPKALRGPAPLFWVFHVLRDYAHTLREAGSRHAAALPGLMADADRFELAVGPVDLIFGHNDLLAANVIDDGNRLWLVDWDYAGFNSPLFDLGGLASNSELAPEACRALIEAYFERPLDDALAYRFAAMTAASLLRETLWSMVSEIASTLDFDYAAYTAENFARYEIARAAFAAMESA